MADPPTHDLFVSYAEADAAWVEGYLLDALTQAGVRTHSEAAFTLGVPHLLEFERAVKASRRTLLVLSPAYLANDFTEFVDLLAQTYGLESGTWPVIPLLLHPVQVPTRLALLTRLEAIDPADWEAVVARLLADLQRPLPAPAPTPPCPYPGMRAFSEADAPFFHGREAEVDDLLQRLHAQRDLGRRFLAVIGPSGSGKSSLVFAGLVPALRQSRLFGPDAWTIVSLRPGAAPLVAPTTLLSPDEPQPGPTFTDLMNAAPVGRLLLVVDQFEELFTLTSQQSPADAATFQEALYRLAAEPGRFVILTARADFYPELMASRLWPLIQAQRAEVLPLGEDGLRRAIIKPAERAGVCVEAALVERLAADATGEPGVLPLVQQTLVLLWEKLERRFLPLRAYEALVLPGPASAGAGSVDTGERTGLEVAAGRHAEATLNTLEAAERDIARRIFLRLVQVGEGRVHTRQQRPVSELRSVGEDLERFDATLERLAANRLLTLSGGDASGERTVDLAHKVLIAGWPWLQHLLVDRREAVEVWQRIDDKAAEWVRLGRGQGGLLDEAELAEAERWLTGPDATELGFREDIPALVAASRAAIDEAHRHELAQARTLADEQRQRAGAEAAARREAERRAEDQVAASRRLRNRLIIAFALGLLTLVASAGAFYSMKQAEQAQHFGRVLAILRQVALQKERGEDERAALLARQAFLLNQGVDELAWAPVDEALRSAVGVPYFGRKIRGPTNWVSDLTFSGNGDVLAAGSSDGAVWLWELNGGGPPKLLEPLTGHQEGLDLEKDNQVVPVAFSPDSRPLLASGGPDRKVRLWAPGEEAWTQLSVLLINGEPLPGVVLSVAFSPNGQTLAAGTMAGTIHRWDVTNPADPRELGELPRNHNEVWSVAFSPVDDNVLASAGTCMTMEDQPQVPPCSVALWDMSQSTSDPIRRLPHHGAVWSVAFSPDGLRLATGTSDGPTGEIRLWNLQDARDEPEVFRGHDEVVDGLGFGPDGLLVSGSHDETVRLWNADRPERPLAVLGGAEEWVRAIAVDPKGRWLASTSGNDSVRLWALDGSGGGNIAPTTFPGPEATGNRQDWVQGLAFAPSGCTLASVRHDGQVLLWSVGQPCTAPEPLARHREQLTSVAFSPNSALLASGSTDGSVILWDMGTREKIARKGHTEGVTSVAFSPDGTQLASGGLDGTVLLWDPNPHGANEALNEITVGHAIHSIAINSDGRTLATGNGDNTVRLWDLSQPGTLIRVLPGHTEAVTAVAFSPDGRLLASGSDDDSIRLWEVGQPDAEPTVLAGHADDVIAVAFSPDGRLLASGSKDQTARLWNLDRDHAESSVLGSGEEWVRAVAFSPDGSTLASGSADGAIRLSVVRDEQLAETVCDTVWRDLPEEEWRRFGGEGADYESCPEQVVPAE